LLSDRAAPCFRRVGGYPLGAHGRRLPFAENLPDDGLARSELAERWARQPTVYASFKDGAEQLGPAHIYYLGLLLNLAIAR
jgi:hypothetical protein